MSGSARLAVITARGGSKRIPCKNVRDFCGKPIIAYSVEAAIGSNLFDEVMVSTDDECIASLAKKLGAVVPFMRSPAASDDYATTHDVLVEVLQDYERSGKTFDCVCCIYPTAPFVTGTKLREACRCFDSENADTVLSVVRYSFPPQRALVKNGGVVSFWMPQYSIVRSQDLEPIFHDAGQFYFCRARSLLDQASLIGPRTFGYEVSELEAQDIDTENDWKIAEIKYELMKEGQSGQA